MQFFDKSNKTCKQQLNEFVERRNTTVDELCKLPKNAEYPKYNREQIIQNTDKYKIYKRLENPNAYLPRCIIQFDADSINQTQNNLNTGYYAIKK